MIEETESEQLDNLFRGWGEIFSKESEKPFITHKNKTDDNSKENS